MKNRFHITENGAKPCKAHIRDCPIGGAHFETKEEAVRAFEFSAAQKNSPFGSLKKKADPYSAHITRAEDRIKKLEKDMLMRDERQKSGTLYHQLLAEGITDEAIEEQLKFESNTREAGVGFMRTENSDVLVMGVTYGGDYKAEEEWGIAHISKSLRAGDYGSDSVIYYEKDGFTILAIEGERSYGWSADPNQNELVQRAEETAISRYRDYAPFEFMKQKWSLQRKTASELRAELKGHVSPLPTKKDELVAAVFQKRHGEGFRTPSIGEFQSGKALVMVTKDPIEAKLYKKMKESHDSGNLRLGNSQNPFARGVLFYDDRDLTREHKSNLIRTEEAQKSAKSYISDTEQKLRENGTLFAVSPRVGADLKDVRDAKFHLNYSPRGHKQIFGQFNKEQLERLANGDYSDIKKDD